MASVVAAFAAAWIVHIIYLMTLGARQRNLQRSLAALEASDREK